MEQLDYNLLFRWFVGLGRDDAVWNHAVFSKNRDRLLPNTDSERIIRSFEQKTFYQPEIGVRIRAALRSVDISKRSLMSRRFPVL